MDLPDQIFKTKAAKYRAVVRNAVERHQIGQPILIGTTSITQSERTFQTCCCDTGVPHKVLNAKHHEQEAEIVAAWPNGNGNNLLLIWLVVVQILLLEKGVQN